MSAPFAPSESPKPGLLGWIAAHENLAFFVVALLWVLALYGRLFTAPFLSGEIDQIAGNAALASWPDLWAHHFAAPFKLAQDLRGTGPIATYEPLFWLTLALDQHLWGANAAGYHATNLVLFLLAGFAGFRLLRTLAVPLRMAGVTALLWLGLPVNSEVAAWISARGYSLCALFLFSAIICAVKSGGTRKALWLTAYLLLSVAALFSHPAGLLVLPMTLLVVLLTRRVSVDTLSLLTALGLAADGAWFTVRHLVGTPETAHAFAPRGVGAAFFEYVQWMVLPARLSMERETSLPTSGLASVLGWVILLGAATAAIVYRRRNPMRSAAMAWLILGLLPFCGLLAIDRGMAERFVYLASAGFVLLVVSRLFAETATPALRKPLTWLVVLWVIWGAWRVQVRAKDWTDPARLYTASLEATPNSSILYLNLGDLAREADDKPTAKHYSELAVERHPVKVDTMLDLGMLLQRLGDSTAAEKQYLHALELAPTDARVFSHLGLLAYEDGHVSAAEGFFGAAIRLNKLDPEPYFRMAQLYQEGGSPDAALVMYQKELKLKPDDKTAKENVRLIKASMAAAAAEQQ